MGGGGGDDLSAMLRPGELPDNANSADSISRAEFDAHLGSQRRMGRFMTAFALLGGTALGYAMHGCTWRSHLPVRKPQNQEAAVDGKVQHAPPEHDKKPASGKDGGRGR